MGSSTHFTQVTASHACSWLIEAMDGAHRTWGVLCPLADSSNGTSAKPRAVWVSAVWTDQTAGPAGWLNPVLKPCLEITFRNTEALSGEWNSIFPYTVHSCSEQSSQQRSVSGT